MRGAAAAAAVGGMREVDEVAARRHVTYSPGSRPVADESAIAAPPHDRSCTTARGRRVDREAPIGARGLIGRGRAEAA